MIAKTRAGTGGMVTYNRRPRSLIGNISSVLLQPVSFFSSFPTTRQWVWVAVLILIAFGFSAVHQPVATDTSQPTDLSMQPIGPSGDVGVPGKGGGAVISGGGAIVSGGGGVDGGFVPPPDSSVPVDGAPAPDVSKTVMSALLAAGGVILGWLLQSFMLCEVPMINGKRPSMGRNLQIAVWASVPLALMLVVQQIYFAIGGKPGQVGLSLLLERWEGFAALPTFSQAVMITLATNFTLFWLWNLVLVYLGGRHALNGKRSAVMLVVVLWVIIGAVLPALTSPGGAKTPLPEPLSLNAPNGTEEVMPQELIKPTPPEAQPVQPGRGMKG